jgi:F0F1-type ATP synthase assembly protein I
MLEANFATEIKDNATIRERLSAVLSNPDVIKAQKDLQNKQKKAVLMSLLIPGCLGIVIGIVLAIAYRDSAWPFFLILPIALGFGIGGIAVWGIRKRQKDTYTAFLTPYVVRALYGDNAIYNPRGSYSRAYLNGLNAFPVNDLRQEDFIQGEYLGVPCNCCDVQSSHQETHTDSKGNTTTTTVIDFSGSVFSFKFNKTVDYRLVVTEGFTFFSGKGIQFESIEFNKMYRTYCEDEHTAFYIITPQLQEGMTDINKSIKGSITFLYRGEELVVVIGGHTTQFNIDPKATLNRNINLIFDSIVPMAYINEELHLSQKFKITEADVAAAEAASKAAEAKKDADQDQTVEGTVNKVVSDLGGDENDTMSSTAASEEKQAEFEAKMDGKLSQAEKMADDAAKDDTSGS